MNTTAENLLAQLKALDGNGSENVMVPVSLVEDCVELIETRAGITIESLVDDVRDARAILGELDYAAMMCCGDEKVQTWVDRLLCRQPEPYKVPPCIVGAQQAAREVLKQRVRLLRDALYMHARVTAGYALEVEQAEEAVDIE